MVGAVGVEMDGSVIFEISNEYKWVLVAVLLNVFTYIASICLVGSGRKKYFTQAKMEEHFGAAHKEAGLGEIKKGGYPDCGSGRYTMAMGYEAWYRFSSLQRAGVNQMDSISMMICMLMSAGLYYPIATAIWGIVYWIGIQLYVVGYLKSPAWRALGAPIVLASRFALPVFTIVSLAQLASKTVVLTAASV